MPLGYSTQESLINASQHRNTMSVTVFLIQSNLSDAALPFVSAANNRHHPEPPSFLYFSLLGW